MSVSLWRVPIMTPGLESGGYVNENLLYFFGTAGFWTRRLSGPNILGRRISARSRRFPRDENPTRVLRLRRRLTLREIRICPHFIDLLRVALRVRSNE